MFIQHVLSIMLMGMATVTKCVMNSGLSIVYYLQDGTLQL